MGLSLSLRDATPSVDQSQSFSHLPPPPTRRQMRLLQVPLCHCLTFKTGPQCADPSRKIPFLQGSCMIKSAYNNGRQVGQILRENNNPWHVCAREFWQQTIAMCCADFRRTSHTRTPVVCATREGNHFHLSQQENANSPPLLSWSPGSVVLADADSCGTESKRLVALGIVLPLYPRPEGPRKSVVTASDNGRKPHDVRIFIPAPRTGWHTGL